MGSDPCTYNVQELYLSVRRQILPVTISINSSNGFRPMHIQCTRTVLDIILHQYTLCHIKINKYMYNKL